MPYYSIRDNYSNGTVGDYLKSTILGNSDLSIVSAYFTIHAYDALKSKLNEIRNLRFLFGEPTFVRSDALQEAKAREYSIVDDRISVPIESRLMQKRISLECSKWLREKAEIRSMVQPNFLHGKMYFVKQTSGIKKAIVGSSNFTVNGLGLGRSRNIELNTIIDSDRDRSELLGWFDSIWNDSTGLVEDVKDEVLKYLERLYVENSPKFLYFKTLFEIFGDYVKDQESNDLLDQESSFYDSQIWNALYDFQKDGVRGAINKIMKHNGCIIADSVGLGKTYEALAVIKYFELLNARVLVLCPKKLSNNWTIYQASQNNMLNPFTNDRFGYTVLYHTDIGRTNGISHANGIDLANFNWGAYDLVVLDESHNFRGNPMETERGNGDIRMNRAKFLMEKVVKSGPRTRVLMLSATPVNNTLRDLRNQIAFITEGREDALYEACGIRDIGQTLKNAQMAFTNWAETEEIRSKTSVLLERLDSSFFKLLDELTIARSRKHVKGFYKIEAIGGFPAREKPFSVYPDIDLDNRFPSYDSINKQILEYRLSVFNPSSYVKPEKRTKYEEMAGRQVLNFTQEDRENFLIGMMKVNFLKRLESSIRSFEISLNRTIEKIEKLQAKISDFIAMNQCSQEQSLEEFQPSEDELEEDGEDIDQWQVGKKLRFDLADIDVESWLTDLNNDKDALIGLYNSAFAVSSSRDAKLALLKEIIKKKVNNPFNPLNKKVIVFTAFADTAKYLYDNLKEWVTEELGLHCGLVTGSFTQTTFGRNNFDSILTNFSPVSKNRSQIPGMNANEQIDILVATDCISEGQNLQDCDYLINYDIHWNPVRIIQRFGRIDRLGSKNKTVQLVNFWPTKDLDNYINLRERVEARMALVDVTATGEDNILNTEQIEDLISDDLKYRNRQLKKLQNEVLDIEDTGESVSLTDFTLDDFRIELQNFLRENRKQLEEAPLGLYALVPAPGNEPDGYNAPREYSQSERDIIKPGVIFCLSQKEASDGNEKVNPLNPYFLVYIREDGTVRFNYTNAKQILEIYRRLCQNQEAPNEVLVEIFNRDTNNGEKMNRYSELLRKAVNEIIQVFTGRQIRMLMGQRDAVLPLENHQPREVGDFELVTWLIVR